MMISVFDRVENIVEKGAKASPRGSLKLGLYGNELNIFI